MTLPTTFYDYCAAHLFYGSLTDTQRAGLTTLAAATDGQPLGFRAYMFATAHHETGRRMQPIRESGTPAYFAKYGVPPLSVALGNTRPGDGALYIGRGYVQLTGRHNYARADAELRAVGMLPPPPTLTDTPDLALQPDIAAAIMVHGMLEGWFTGKRLADYLPTDPNKYALVSQFIAARRIINGQDRAKDIAGYAQLYQYALRA